MILVHARSKENKAIYFVMPHNGAVEAEGAQECKTVSTDYEEQRVRVVLCGWWPCLTPLYYYNYYKIITKNETFL